MLRAVLLQPVEALNALVGSQQQGVPGVRLGAESSCRSQNRASEPFSRALRDVHETTTWLRKQTWSSPPDNTGDYFNTSRS